MVAPRLIQVAALLVALALVTPSECSRRHRRHRDEPEPTPTPTPTPVPTPEPPRLRTPAAAPVTYALGCEDNSAWKDIDGNGCDVYVSEGWCVGSYFAPGSEDKADANSKPGPEDSCCACGRGRGGCLQARIDQYCMEQGAGVVARKAHLVWNCYAYVGTRSRRQCVNTGGWDEDCAEGLSAADEPVKHNDAIHALLREGCVSKKEHEERKHEREAAKREEHKAKESGEVYGSCMQEAMDALCSEEFAPGAVSRRAYAQYYCCTKTVDPAEATPEQSLACVDKNGYFVECAPCDTSDETSFAIMSKQLRAVMWNGCRSKLSALPSARAAALGVGTGARSPRARA